MSDDKYEVFLKVTKVSYVRVVLDNDNPGNYTDATMGQAVLSVPTVVDSCGDADYVSAHYLTFPDAKDTYLFAGGQAVGDGIGLDLLATRKLPADNAETADFLTSQVI